MLTWYDVLGISPGASPGEVRSAYQARARQLAPPMLTGVPRCKVLKAAEVAKAAADEAWRVLGEPVARQLYDSQIGARGNGEGLDRPEPVPSGPGGEIYGRGINADIVMAALADVMTPHPSPARRVIVPDLLWSLSGRRASA